MGVRTRAARARAAAQLADDWLWPQWPRPWTTAVGNVGSPHRAVVDPCGLVTPWAAGWSLDWWIGGDDRWHLPSRESGIRQRLVAGTPVIETAMRIPGGDAIQHVYAIRAQEDLVVVEVANHSPVPVALALAVRPANPQGLAVVERIAIRDTTVTVDGRPALLFAKRPTVMAGSTLADGDSAWTVTGGRAGSSLPASLRCKAGLAQAAFVFPLPHGTSISVVLPLGGAAARPELPAVLPSGEDVARSWQAQTRRGMRLVLPPGRLADTVEANRRALLLFHTGDDVRSELHTSDRCRFADAALLLAALERYGFHDDAAEVLRSYPGRRRPDPYDLLGPDAAAEAGDRRALDRVEGMVEAASPTFSWPEAMGPQGLATAEFLILVRNLLVRELRPVGADPAPPALALCTMVPDAWLGQGVEVHDAPTAHGRISFAVRWHGERPALLWELEPHPAVEPVQLRTPGLDPTWSTDAPSGEALLSPVPTRSFS